ncbi:hypothetical protein CDV36_000455 [Fusarium kuroshium]|uniref:Uncharacterized protein n=1 Tax=Fusarium kuroshium TaxID=2010991 RepID=A0A3M2SQF5_9HYPO|nr:hypothetical protein CDV36_000455 [Fusarium kuroshium]
MPLGTPRLNPYNKLLSRLFEFLALFSILKKAAGPHVITNHDSSTLEATRRRFLKNLCFVCDYKKGGDTTTSIAVENRPDCFMFWVAGNVTPSPKVVEFLNGVLSHLQGAEAGDNIQKHRLEVRLTEDTIQFGTSRLKKECKLLCNAAKKCQGYLSTGISGTSVNDLESLKNWLIQFEFNTTADILSLCQATYRARRDHQLRTLQVLSREDGAAVEHAKAFKTVEHFVGRLAERIRVPKELVEDASRLGTLLNSYRVAAIPAPPPETVPPADGLTNLNSIAKRMLRSGDPKLNDFQEFLATLNGQMGLEDKVRTMYDREDIKPSVHAELQMLEFFHRGKRVFFDNDRYIACSKLACLGCRLYFRHHPGRFVEPDSHQKVYINWRPILLHEGPGDPLFLEQRAILSHVSEDISKLLETDIAVQQMNAISHPDSITNITVSADSVFDSSELEYESPGGNETDEETTPATEASLKVDGESPESDGESEGGVAL